MFLFKDAISNHTPNLEKCTDIELTMFIMNNWQKIIPFKFKSSQPLRIYQKTGLLILAAHPGDSMNLKYYTSELMQSINNFLKQKLITQIIVRNKLQY